MTLDSFKEIKPYIVAGAVQTIIVGGASWIALRGTSALVAGCLGVIAPLASIVSVVAMQTLFDKAPAGEIRNRLDKIFFITGFIMTLALSLSAVALGFPISPSLVFLLSLTNVVIGFFALLLGTF